MSRIRESARGEECQVRIPYVCTGNPEHTIWSHARWGAAGKGMGRKALDVCGAYACTACDAAYDQMAGQHDMTRAQLDAAWCAGHFRSLVILSAKGLI